MPPSLEDQEEEEQLEHNMASSRKKGEADEKAIESSEAPDGEKDSGKLRMLLHKLKPSLNEQALEALVQSCLKAGDI